MDELVTEAEKLASQGVRELNIIAQETTVYGIDLYGEKKLHELLSRLAEIDGIHWIRILYCYPEEIYPELVETIKNTPKICHYLDIPIQHCSDGILRKMGRKTTRADLCRIIGELRKKIPDIALRTSLISGFPGETEEEHRELAEFIKDIRFDHLGVFTYSREDGTPAADMPGQIPENVKQERRDELMILQQEIAAQSGKEKAGRETEVFVEGFLPDDNIYIGRTPSDAPDVDSYIFFDSDRELATGDIVRCLITGANEYDLMGEMIYESAE